MNFHTRKTEIAQNHTERSFQKKAWSLERLGIVFAMIGTIAQVISLGVHIADSIDKCQPQVKKTIHIEEELK